MYGTGTKKMLNLMILNILEKYSDVDHCLTQKRIIELLDLEYGMQCDRKSVATNINSLKEMGYDIVKERNGVYLIREFEDWELRLLIDSVLFSQTISRARAKQLIEKLKTLGNKYFSAKVKHIVNLPELHRSDNLSVALTLDALNDAISQNKKISFTYNSYGEDLKLHPRRAESYVVSPYQMVATNGRYYLIANNDKYDDFSHYRVDKMTEVKILQEPARPVKEFAPNGLNLPQHMAEHIYMFSGESVRVKFWAQRQMLDALFDWFGRDFDILRRDGDRLLISVRVNLQAMKYWILQFGERVEVIEPKTLREEICNIAEKIRNAHADTVDAEEPLDLLISDWSHNTPNEPKPNFLVIGAGDFGVKAIDAINSRNDEQLDFIDDVEFVALNEDDLKMSCSDPVYVNGIKFTAWSFDPEIQKRLDEVELVMVVTDEKTLKSAIAFTAGTRKTKIFVTPDTSGESSSGNIFVQFDAEHFFENVYRAICSFRDLLYHNGGADFAKVNADIFKNDADFAIAFYDDNFLELTDKDNLEGAKKVLCVATEARAGNFQEIIVQAAFPDAEVSWSVIVDNSLEPGAVRAMLVALK